MGEGAISALCTALVIGAVSDGRIGCCYVMGNGGRARERGRRPLSPVDVPLMPR